MKVQSQIHYVDSVMAKVKATTGKNKPDKPYMLLVTSFSFFHACIFLIRTYRYKPLSAGEDEINRWRVLTKKFHYEMINQEPRIGINGMWKMEVNDLDKKAMTFLNQYGNFLGLAFLISVL